MRSNGETEISASVVSLARNRGVVLEVQTPQCRYHRVRRFRIGDVDAARIPEQSAHRVHVHLHVSSVALRNFVASSAM
jgi:hypothetical protein